MSKANYALRLQPSLKAAAERLAAAEGVSLNQLINVAVAEKLSAMETASYFSDRAARARPGAITQLARRRRRRTAAGWRRSLICA